MKGSKLSRIPCKVYYGRARFFREIAFRAWRDYQDKQSDRWGRDVTWGDGDELRFGVLPDETVFFDIFEGVKISPPTIRDVRVFTDVTIEKLFRNSDLPEIEPLLEAVGRN